MQEYRPRAAGGNPPGPTAVSLLSRVLPRVRAWRSPPTEWRPRQQARIWSSGISVSFSLRISAFDNQTLARVRIFPIAGDEGYSIQRETRLRCAPAACGRRFEGGKRLAPENAMMDQSTVRRACIGSEFKWAMTAPPPEAVLVVCFTPPSSRRWTVTTFFEEFDRVRRLGNTGGQALVLLSEGTWPRLPERLIRPHAGLEMTSILGESHDGLAFAPIEIGRHSLASGGRKFTSCSAEMRTISATSVRLCSWLNSASSFCVGDTQNSARAGLSDLLK
jgi:hypothetical protein